MADKSVDTNSGKNESSDTKKVEVTVIEKVVRPGDNDAIKGNPGVDWRDSVKPKK